MFANHSSGKIRGVKIKCLSIRQPWAWLIVNGKKPVENRTWPTQVRGWIAIHAGKTLASPEERIWIQRKFPQIPLPSNLDTGKIVGVAHLIDCVELHPSPWFEGPFGFVFDRAAVFNGPALRGALGFFTTDLPKHLCPGLTGKELVLGK